MNTYLNIKLNYRERIELLLDNNSFRELDSLKTHRCNEVIYLVIYFILLIFLNND